VDHTKELTEIPCTCNGMHRAVYTCPRGFVERRMARTVAGGTKVVPTYHIPAQRVTDSIHTMGLTWCGRSVRDLKHVSAPNSPSSYEGPEILCEVCAKRLKKAESNGLAA